MHQELKEIKEHEEVYFHIEFRDKNKKDVNSFKLRNFLSDNSNQELKN